MILAQLGHANHFYSSFLVLGSILHTCSLVPQELPVLLL